MAKAPGLYRPDGRPARQFGDEIVEPGEPFTGSTLSTIRALVTDHDPAASNAGRTATPAPRQTVASAPAPAPDQPSHPHPDPLPDPLPDEQLTDHALNLEDLDAYATDHLQALQEMQQAAAHSPSPPTHSPVEALILHPPQPSVRDNWRRLVIVEGEPGRTLRSALGRPRVLAVIFLLALTAWRP